MALAPKIQEMNLSRNNEAIAKEWIHSLEEDLIKVASWNAAQLVEEKAEEWIALDRMATLHNQLRAVTLEWTSMLSARNIHFDCAIHELIPLTARYLPDLEKVSRRTGMTRPVERHHGVCLRCKATTVREPSPLIREAAAAAIAAPSLPETGLPKTSYALVKYMIDTLFSNKKRPSKEVLP